ncbi:hypothetical protein RJ639_014965 [Escallonia herrerae]|uniref:Exocyst subunit Exo70 family protein n=1 Tax=Escallonia herrerae TaxID=1293975 RepID=A0AA88VK71_9ASTE|nr:hypothetical protein RJ639_014965 [Escallonia herrerae]
MSSLRTAWQIISSIEQKDESRKNDDHMALFRDYRSQGVIPHRGCFITESTFSHLYLPRITNPNEKFSLLIYFHDGGFTAKITFSPLYHNYLNSVVAKGNTLAVFVEYRLGISRVWTWKPCFIHPIIFLAMGDTESTIPAYDGEQHVIVAAQHIVKALVASKNLSNEMRKILADLDTHLSTMIKLTESEARWTSEVEDLLRCAQKKVINWQSNKSMIWDSGPQGVAEYLQAVDEVRRLIESLGSLLSSTSGKEKELLDLAHSVLQMAMARLEEELIHILACNNLSFEQICPPARSFGGVDEELAVLTLDDSVEEKSPRVSSGTESEEFIIDLVRPDVISDIKSIAHIMFASSYNQEFCEAFVSFWKDALDEFLVILGVDKLSIEDVMDMEWGRLYRRIRRWCRASKVIIRFFLASQKRLFDQVLGELGSPSLVCFIEASKVSMLRLLNFGEAVAIAPPLPERLSCFIDMYEVLASLLQDIDALFNEGDGCFIRNEFHELLTKLGDSVRATFANLGIELHQTHL